MKNTILKYFLKDLETFLEIQTIPVFVVMHDRINTRGINILVVF